MNLIFPLRRLSSLSREQFQKCRLKIHGPLVRKHADALRIRRYIQVRTLDDPINAVLRDRHKAEMPHDGVAELRRGSREASEKAFTTPDGRAAAAILIEDERKRVDLDRSALRIANERPLIG